MALRHPTYSFLVQMSKLDLEILVKALAMLPNTEPHQANVKLAIEVYTIFTSITCPFPVDVRLSKASTMASAHIKPPPAKSATRKENV